MNSLEQRIEAGGAILALDTNALTGFQRLADLCNHVNLLRAPPDPLDIRLCVPSVVHMEVLFDLQQHYGSTFDAKQVLDGLLTKGLEIKPFAEKHAEQAAARLAANFPQPADWHASKRKRCIQCLGLRENHIQPLGSGKRCGATVDWLIAAHAAQEGWILVTNDDGPEFVGLHLKMTLEHLEQCLQDLLARRRNHAGRAS
jgi:predicted nucleic acid-binding protein